MALDLRLALNAISDVVANRPLPIREFDQIYMKLGDMVVHAEHVARRCDKRRIVFVGDGDGIGLSVAHLMEEQVIGYGPSHITILDFDERVVDSVNTFARKHDCNERIGARLYNVIDPLPSHLVDTFDAFHINPPWGQHNDGDSVVVFLERAINLVKVGAIGVAVIADDVDLAWTQNVLRRTQSRALAEGLVVEEMIPAFHSYHLDDAPGLRSCTLVLRKIVRSEMINVRLPFERLTNFYGRNTPLQVQYVRAKPGRGLSANIDYDLEKVVDGG